MVTFDWSLTLQVTYAIRNDPDKTPPESPWLITENFVNEHHCDLRVHGADNVNPIDPKRLIIFPRTEGVSSSTLRERVLDCLIEMNVTGKSGSASEKLARFLIENIKKEFRQE